MCARVEVVPLQNIFLQDVVVCGLRYCLVVGGGGVYDW